MPSISSWQDHIEKADSSQVPCAGLSLDSSACWPSHGVEYGRHVSSSGMMKCITTRPNKTTAFILAFGDRKGKNGVG